MLESSRGSSLEEIIIISGLLLVQVIYGVYMVFLNQILSLGVNALFLIIFGGLATAIFLLPFAVALEKKKWPTELRPILMAQIFLISLGMALFQNLILMGIKLTSPAIASAMPNLAPGFIFLIAACLRYEKFVVSCWYTRAKVIGTLVCLSGALTMSLFQSPTNMPEATYNAPSSSGLGNVSTNDWILGCFYLLSAVVILSCSTVLQAATMMRFPAPLSLCVITSVAGSLITALVQFIVEGKISAGSSPTIGIKGIAAFVLMGGVGIGTSVAFQTWCMIRKGPVLVSIFSPIQTVCAVILSAIFLRQLISLGSLAGIVLMFAGLYMVLWAKKNECIIKLEEQDANQNQAVEDIERPLLS